MVNFIYQTLQTLFVDISQKMLLIQLGQLSTSNAPTVCDNRLVEFNITKWISHNFITQRWFCCAYKQNVFRKQWLKWKASFCFCIHPSQISIVCIIISIELFLVVDVSVIVLNGKVLSSFEIRNWDFALVLCANID